MGINPELHGRAQGTRTRPFLRLAPPAAMAVLLLISSLACDTGRGPKKTTNAQSERDSTAKASAGTRAGTGAKARAGAAEKQTAARRESEPAQGTGYVRLSFRRCVQFEPHWTTIHVGQSLTWHSDLTTSVTVRVPAGAFDRTEYVVPAGKSVRTGPARSPGSYPIWSQPGACQGIPVGPRGAGPGVTVEGTASR